MNIFSQNYPHKIQLTATRPCLTSDSRRKPIVASFDSPQNSASAKFNGSKYFTAGLSLAAKFCKSAFDSDTDVEARPVGEGANAHTDAIVAARITDFMVLLEL